MSVADEFVLQDGSEEGERGLGCIENKTVDLAQDSN